MGTAWAGEKKSKVFAYRYDQRVPGSTQVNHAAEKYIHRRSLCEPSLTKLYR